MRKPLQQFRYSIVYVVLIVVFFIILFKLINLQLVHGEEYLMQSKTRTTATLPIKAPRGEIYDRYGRPLVTNRMGFTVVMQKQKITNKQLNEQIDSMVNVLKTSQDNYIDTLPIEYIKPYNFTAEDISGLLKMYKLSNDLSGDQALDAIIKRYEIEEEDKAKARLIAGIRYEMAKRSFSASNPFIFAQDVSMQTVAVFQEQSEYFQGVEIVEEPIREYVDGTLASHIIGRVGVIYAEEYAEKKNQGYSMTDIVGKDGIEKYLESSLKGVDGLTSVTTLSDGTKIIKDAKMGSYGVLTIDGKLQKVLENSLKSNIIGMRSQKDAGNANAGAGVVIDVNTGEILAMASYPSFDLKTFNQDYSKLSENTNKPLYNRAISGGYAPGSTFKVLTSLAGLQEGVISPTETITDHGVYREYENQGYAPACWIWNEHYGTHGAINVVSALKVSCNYFFYEVANRLGIKNLNKYGTAVGLGQVTGIEIGGESAGIMAGPDYRSRNGDKWYAGDTLQAAIGQSDNLLTPLQLANYIATIANGGTRYKPHLVKAIKSYDGGKAVNEIQPTVVSKLDITDRNYNTVLQGMKDVSEAGTASSVFANYKVSVGAKTGTATVNKSAVNAVFVATAPLEKPEIAVAIVVEKGGHGSYAAPIAKDIFDYYFNIETITSPIDTVNTLLQ